MKTAEMASLQPPHRTNDTRDGSLGRVAEEITELVGETPILHLRKLVAAGSADVYAKLEYLNPGGSIKDRAALGMITKAERAGTLRPGATIFEATAGNTGVGLALIGNGRGYKTVLAVPEGFSQEKVTLMEALGAEVIRTPAADGMQGAIDYMKERAARTLILSSPGNSKIRTIPTITTKPRAASSTNSWADRLMPSTSSAAVRAVRLAA